MLYIHTYTHMYIDVYIHIYLYIYINLEVFLEGRERPSHTLVPCVDSLFVKNLQL